jgi:two-component system sensor histidine kinase ChiS
MDGEAPEKVMLPARPETPDFSAALPSGASYRITIKVDAMDPGRNLAIGIPAYAGISAVYADGKLLYDKGKGPDAPPLLLTDAPSGALSLALRLDAGSRPLEAASSYPASILFGEADAVGRARVSTGAAMAFLAGYYLLLGLFVFILFIFCRKNVEFLAFSALLLVTGACELFKLGIAFRFMNPSPEGLEPARLAFLCLQVLGLAFFLHSLYRPRIKRAVSAALYAPPSLLTAAVLAVLAAARLAEPGATARELARAAMPALYAAVEGWAALFTAAAAAVLAFLAAKGDRKARALAPAALVLLALCAAGRFGPESMPALRLAPSAGSVAFSAVVVLMLIKKIAGSFESTELLNGYVASVSKAVKSFIPREFLEHLQKEDLVDLRLGDHAKEEMTIFFSDIRAFTQLSEGLTVEENFAFINSYLSRVVPIIRENGGFVDKYVGDGIMALYPGPKGPDAAIRSAIAMQEKMVEYNGHRAKMGYKPISMGVGVHTGDLMLGVVGVEERMENTVISDAVNLSSRLQAITKAFNISLAISEKTFKELDDPGVYKYRFIGKVKVKGKAEPISVFEIFDGIEPDYFERKMKANMFFEQGMLSYYQKDFAGAMYYFKRVLDIIPEDGAAGFYLDNCMNRATL